MAKKNRTHRNADHRVYTIIHAEGDLEGCRSEVHGRAWFDAVRQGRLTVVDFGNKVARVAKGFYCFIKSKTEVAFVSSARLLNSWEIIDKAFLFSGALSKREVARRRKENQPLIPAEPILGERRARVGKKEFIHKFAVGYTQPVY